MDRELTGLDALLLERLRDELLGDACRLTVLDRPAHDVAAEDVQKHVQVEVRPLRRSEQLGDVPAPEFVGSRGEQLGLGVISERIWLIRPSMPDFSPAPSMIVVSSLPTTTRRA
jgi:hypothetical protein